MKKKVQKDAHLVLRLSKGMKLELESLASKNKTSISEVVRYSVNELVKSNKVA
jgi:hypothetical protein